MKKLKLLIFTVTYSILLVVESCAPGSVLKNQTPVISNATLSVCNLSFINEELNCPVILKDKLPILWQNNTDHLIVYANDFDLYLYENDEFKFLKKHEFFEPTIINKTILPFQKSLTLYDISYLKNDKNFTPGKYKFVSKCFYNNVINEVNLFFEIE